MYCCTQCIHPPIVCRRCAVSTHTHNPLIVEEWDFKQGFWQRVPLGNLGLVFELGHDGKRCPRLLNKTRYMTFVHKHGTHEMNVCFCRCAVIGNDASPDATQLLEVGFWPGSWERPMTTFSIYVMQELHLLSVQAHTNALDYFMCLKQRTDGVCPNDMKVSSHCSSC